MQDLSQRDIPTLHKLVGIFSDLADNTEEAGQAQVWKVVSETMAGLKEMLLASDAGESPKT